jgi:ElaB/YqjD/DUF883 family membrane-anchored ribosome-binding protein
MELYYKDLISEDASLEKLVDDLMLVVQGADELAQVAGTSLGELDKEEVTSGLQRIKLGYQHLRQHAIAGALVTDKLMRQYPYSTAGFAFAFGLLAGRYLNRRHRS